MQTVCTTCRNLLILTDSRLALFDYEKCTLFVVLIIALFPFSGTAATTAVTSTADGGAGSLRQVIGNSAVGDTIVFSVTGAILLTNGELLINKQLTILGPGAGLLSVERSAAGG